MIDSARLFRASARLQASPLTPPETDPLEGVEIAVESGVEASISPNSALEPPSSGSPDDYAQLQRRLILATLIVSALAVSITALVFSLHTAASLLVGALGGVLYLRLLARSVGKLGNGSKKVGKTQLLVPVVLVLAGARIPQLDLLPALLGFLLYKPALILQAFSET